MIKTVSMNYFRGHCRVLEFGPNINIICGPNESGKSTVKEAFAFVWYGTDSNGNSPDHLITKGQDKTEVSVTTQHATITRTKARGKTSVIKFARGALPPVSMNQTELEALLKLKLDTFMCCWNAGYFMSLKDVKQLAVLGELAAVDRRALLQSMLPAGTQIPAKVKLVSPKIDADAIAGERRQLQNVKASDEGALSQVRAQLSQLTAQDDVDTESYSGALNDLNAQLAAHDFYRQALAKYQTDAMRFGESLNRRGAIEAGILASKVPPPEQFKFMEDTIAQLTKKEGDVRAATVTLGKKLKPVPFPPKKPAAPKAGSKCDACGQTVGEDHVNHIMGSYEKELLAYNKEAREIATFNEKVNATIKMGLDEAQGIMVDLTNLKSEHKQLTLSKANVEANLVKLQRELVEIQKIKEPAAPEKPPGDEKTLRQQQLDISTALNVAQRQATQLGQMREQESLLVSAIAVKERQCADYGALEQALKDLPKVETRKILETLQVEGVDVELVDGSLAISAGGIPYSSLSSGRKMKSDMSFCVSLRKAAGARAPSWLFVDDTELMDQWRYLVPADLQTFVAKVETEVDEVTVVQQ
jgi:hypothetical protein